MRVVVVVNVGRLAVRSFSTAIPTAPVTKPMGDSPAAKAALSSSSSLLRNDWTRPEIQAIFDSPLVDLLFFGVCSLFFSLYLLGVHTLALTIGLRPSPAL